MFQYIKRNILRRGASPNNDFGFLADQLILHHIDLIQVIQVINSCFGFFRLWTKPLYMYRKLEKVSIF